MTLHEILLSVARDIPIDEVVTQATREAIEARHAYFYRALVETEKSLAQIAAVVGRCHGSVIYGAVRYAERTGQPAPRGRIYRWQALRKAS